MTDEQFREFIAALPPHEVAHVELKCGLSLDDPDSRAKVLRAILAMSSLLDGGHVIVGIDDTDQRRVDWSRGDIDSWDANRLGACLKEVCLTQPPAVAVSRRPFANSEVIHIEVSGFPEIPCVCAKDQDPAPRPTGTEASIPSSKKKPKPILRKGAIYIRDGAPPRTRYAQEPEDFRNLFDASFNRRMAKLGAILRIETAPTKTQPALISELASARQRQFFDEAVGDSASRAHWEFHVQPLAVDHVHERPSNQALVTRLESVVVRPQVGDEFPLVVPAKLTYGDGYVESVVDLDVRPERWRLHDDGLFLCTQALLWDWRERHPILKEQQYEAILGAVQAEAIYRALLGLYSFAGRLAASWGCQHSAFLTAKLRKVQGRRLMFWSPGLWDRTAVFSGETLTAIRGDIVDVPKMLHSPQVLASGTTRRVFEQFGYSASDEVMKVIGVSI